jgi:(p)ppGpp synthase/HD superfamily hydrolase
MNTLTQIAKTISFRLHIDQFYDKEKNISYDFHINQVIDLVSDYGYIAEMIAALHDSIEDTEVTENSLKELLLIEIAKNQIKLKSSEDSIEELINFVGHSVYLLSDEEGHNRKERKIKTNRKLSYVTMEYADVLIVKIADRIANMNYSYNSNNNSIMKMYYKEFEEFRNAVYRDYIPTELINDLDKVYEKIRIYLNK